MRFDNFSELSRVVLEIRHVMELREEVDIGGIRCRRSDALVTGFSFLKFTFDPFVD